jgi:hypothetical protein
VLNQNTAGGTTSDLGKDLDQVAAGIALGIKRGATSRLTPRRDLRDYGRGTAAASKSWLLALYE